MDKPTASPTSLPKGNPKALHLLGETLHYLSASETDLLAKAHYCNEGDRLKALATANPVQKVTQLADKFETLLSLQDDPIPVMKQALQATEECGLIYMASAVRTDSPLASVMALLHDSPAAWNLLNLRDLPDLLEIDDPIQLIDEPRYGP